MFRGGGGWGMFGAGGLKMTRGNAPTSLAGGTSINGPGLPDTRPTFSHEYYLIPLIAVTIKSHSI